MKINILGFIVGVFVIIIILNPQSPAYAQVTLDGTMGTSVLLEGPDYRIRAEYGHQAGTNLFHSFQDFNINTDESATFSGPGSVRNIISRVTGGNSSWINGKIRSAITGADLYLVNPAGVMFGADATLDISGSFHVSTADYLRMQGNERFYAMPREGEELSAAPPTAFGFLDSDVAPIIFEAREIEKPDSGDNPATGLCVPEQETVSVIGGDIKVAATYYEDPVTGRTVLLENLKAPRGRVNIASVASKGEVLPTETGLEITSEKPGNITLDHALISVTGEGSGNVFIRGGQLYADNSIIEADTEGDKDGGITSIHAQAFSLTRSEIFSDTRGSGKGGDITLDVAESISISDTSRIFASATGYDNPDNGDAGTVLIETGKLSLSGGGTIAGDTDGPGKGGNITIRAEESVSISGWQTEITSRARGEGPEPGHGGTILIETPNLSLSDKAVISSDTYWGDAKGGNIIISGYNSEFSEHLEISDAQVLSGAIDAEYAEAGQGGTVEIKAENIVFTEGGKIGSESEGGGKGGDVFIYAGSVSFSGENDKGGSKVYTSAKSTEDYAGDAGNIFLEAENISFSNNGGITASTEGPGNAGSADVKTATLEINGGSVSSSSNSEGKGGNAGIISITAEDNIRLQNNSSITTETAGYGVAGDITLKTCKLELNTGSSVSSESRLQSDSAGDAGTITIDTCDLVLDNESAVTTEAEGGGGGRIFVKAEKLLYLLDSNISSSVKKGEGKGGDVTVGSLSPEGMKQGAEFVILNRSDITANADFGDGGAIFIITENYIKSADSNVTATSRRGNDGTVRIEAPDTDISSSMVILPGNYLDATRWMKKSCAARAGEKASRFIFKGRHAMSTAFTDLHPGPRIWMDDEDE